MLSRVRGFSASFSPDLGLTESHTWWVGTDLNQEWKYKNEVEKESISYYSYSRTVRFLMFYIIYEVFGLTDAAELPTKEVPMKQEV